MLFVLLLLLSLMALYALRHPQTPARTVWISVKGKTLGFYPLNRDRVLRVTGPIGTTVIAIHNGEATIISAPCAHKFCQKMGPIPQHGNAMICIPNQIIVEIKGLGEKGTDAVSR